MSEIRSLLLTDVVGSTQLSEELGDRAMAELWSAHDRAARDLLPRWRGREIDKTDGMLLLFDAAADAVGYALAYHDALAGLHVPLKARAGLHVGAVILRENHADDVLRGAKPLEVDGLAKPMAARVMSLANGGQTLITPDALEALGDTGLRRQSHGHWVMKGVAEPVELFEVGPDESLFSAPPDSDKVYRVVRSGDRWVPVREIPNNLPQQNTSFIGRERELADLKTRLSKARLITLLGMGGLGKTRLSLQVALELMPQFPDGAWFIDLSLIRDPALVLPEAARVLDVSEEPGRALLDTLCAQVKPRRLLLILDNCEHLLDAAGDLVDALLKAAPNVRVLASSREPLDVPGEASYPILPLPLPNRGDGLAALMRSTAARLFVDRVQAHRPDFSLQDDGAAEVADLVVRLEGIPLAIELAAARMRTLDVAQINAGLARRYDVLTGGSRRLQARQQTLRALVDWSYEMLDAAEQCVFDRLGVFAGGFDTPSAVAVCGVDPVSADTVAPILVSLMEKSLLMREELADGVRFRMLETLRDYARGKLDERADAAGHAARHCLHFFALAKDGNRGLQGAEQARWTRRLETELDNVRAATAVALGGGVEPFVAVKLGVALMGFWMLCGYASEGRRTVRAALALPTVKESPLASAWALYVGAALAGSQGEHAEAQQMLETCLDLRREQGNPVEIAATLSTLSLTRLKAGDADGARQVEREALQMFRELEDRAGEAIGLLHLGQIELYAGADDPARVHLDQALAMARELQNAEMEAESLRLLGESALARGDIAVAAGHFEQALQVSRSAADRRGEAHALQYLGRTALASGDIAAAARQLGEALRSFAAQELRDLVVDCLEDIAELALARQRAEAAAELASAATVARTRLALARSPRDQARWEATLARVREQAGAGFDLGASRGRRWEIDEAVKAGLALAAG